MPTKLSFDRERVIPETEALGLDIEKGAAGIFVPGSEPKEVEAVVKLVRRRAHLTVSEKVKTVQTFKSRKGRIKLSPLELKRQKLRRKYQKLRQAKLATAGG